MFETALALPFERAPPHPQRVERRSGHLVMSIGEIADIEARLNRPTLAATLAEALDLDTLARIAGL